MNVAHPPVGPLPLLRHYLRPAAGRVSLLALLMSGGIALQLINPQVIRRFIDQATAPSPGGDLWPIAILFLGLAVLQQAAQLAANYVASDVGWRATNALRADLTSHCLALDLAFYQDRTPGELISRVDGDVSLLAEFFSRFVVQVLGNGILVVGIVVLLFREGWAFGVIGVGYALLQFGLLSSLRRRFVTFGVASADASAEMLGFLEETCVTTEDIRGLGAETFVLSRHFDLATRWLETGRRLAMLNSGLFSVTLLAYTLAMALTLSAGIIQFRAGDLTIGALFLVTYYIDRLETPLNVMRGQASQLYDALAGIRRIGELLAHQPTIVSGQLESLPPGPLDLELEHVRFAYGEVSVVDDVSFALRPGEVTGLIGRTGSGKTTLTRLIFRLWEPQAGVIRLGGRDTRELDLAALRRRVALVTQDVQILTASVRDNLTLFDDTVNDGRLEQALEELRLKSWVRELAHGLDTQLGAGGHGLSAGEAQLLACARAFLKDPGLIVLDEASARLDPVTERRLERTLDRLLPGRTAIIVAHRLSTLRRADRVILLADGSVIENGPREALAADPGSHFHRLLRSGLELDQAVAAELDQRDRPGPAPREARP